VCLPYLLVLKYRRTRLNSEVIYSGKDSICRKDKRQKEGGWQTKKKHLARKMFQQKYLGLTGV